MAMVVRRDIQDSDAFLELRDMRCVDYDTGYAWTVLARENIHDHDDVDADFVELQNMSEEHKKIVWDSFIEDLKNPLTELGN